MKPTPPHHKTVAIPRADIVAGYGGVRIIGVKAYIIVAASPVGDKAQPPPPGMVYVVVAPYTRGAGA
jgi:hypothetical protein